MCCGQHNARATRWPEELNRGSHLAGVCCREEERGGRRELPSHSALSSEKNGAERTVDGTVACAGARELDGSVGERLDGQDGLPCVAACVHVRQTRRAHTGIKPCLHAALLLAPQQCCQGSARSCRRGHAARRPKQVCRRAGPVAVWRWPAHQGSATRPRRPRRPRAGSARVRRRCAEAGTPAGACPVPCHQARGLLAV